MAVMARFLALIVTELRLVLIKGVSVMSKVHASGLDVAMEVVVAEVIALLMMCVEQGRAVMVAMAQLLALIVQELRRALQVSVTVISTGCVKAVAVLRECFAATHITGG